MLPLCACDIERTIVAMLSISCKHWDWDKVRADAAVTALPAQACRGPEGHVKNAPQGWQPRHASIEFPDLSARAHALIIC